MRLPSRGAGKEMGLLKGSPGMSSDKASSGTGNQYFFERMTGLRIYMLTWTSDHLQLHLDIIDKLPKQSTR